LVGDIAIEHHWKWANNNDNPEIGIRFMIGKSVFHYPIFQNPTRRDKILEKLGEGGMSSFSEKYNRLIPQAGGVVYKARTPSSNVFFAKFQETSLAARCRNFE
jgi:hypothetical protein